MPLRAPLRAPLRLPLSDVLFPKGHPDRVGPFRFSEKGLRVFRELYVTTKDSRGTRHEYRQPSNEAVPPGHDIIKVRQAGMFRLAEMLSDESRVNLFVAQKAADGVIVRRLPKHGGAIKLNKLLLTLQDKRETTQRMDK